MWPKPFFEIAFEFFGCACLYYEKKITSRMVEELNLVKLLQGEKNRNKNEMRLHIKEFWPHCAILVDILFYMYFTTLSSCLLSLIWSLFFFHFPLYNSLSHFIMIYMLEKKGKHKKIQLLPWLVFCRAKLQNFLLKYTPFPQNFPMKK